MLPTDLPLAFRRGLVRGWRALLRDRQKGRVFLMTLPTLGFLQLLTVILLAVFSAHTLLLTRGDLRLEVALSASDQDVQELYAALRALPTVATVAFVPREQVLEQERTRDPGLVAFIEKHRLQNPFPDSFAITLRNLQGYDALRSFLEEDRWQFTLQPSFFTALTDREMRVRDLLSITRIAGFLGVALFILGCCGLLGTLIHHMRRSSRARVDEMRLEQLLGASTFDSLVPRAVHIASFLFIGMAITTAAVLALLVLVPFVAPFTFGDGTLRLAYEQLWQSIMRMGAFLFLAELALMLTVAAGGVLFAMRQHSA